MKKNLIYILIAIVVIILIVVFAMGGKKSTAPIGEPINTEPTTTILEEPPAPETPAETPAETP